MRRSYQAADFSQEVSEAGDGVRLPGVREREEDGEGRDREEEEDEDGALLGRWGRRGGGMVQSGTDDGGFDREMANPRQAWEVTSAVADASMPGGNHEAGF